MSAKDINAVAKVTIATGGSYLFVSLSVTSTKVMVAVAVISAIGSLEWYDRRRQNEKI